MNFLEDIQKKPLIADGAMGTLIYEKGYFINTSYEHLSVSQPALIEELHRAYVDAGAAVILTNTFGANRIKLQAHGLADQIEAINTAGVALARQAAGSSTYVLGSVGPILQSEQLYSDHHSEELEAHFNEQMGYLAAAGIDGFQLETFTHAQEALLAARVAKRFELPVCVSVTVGKDGETRRGESIEQIVRALDASEAVDVIGINCGLGPAAAFSIAERALPLTGKPFSVQANSGLPQEVEGRLIYMTTPEYFSEYAKRLIEIGVRMVGGCCGTTPSHIAMMSKQVGSLSGVKEHIEITHHHQHDTEPVTTIPMSQKCRFGAKLAAGEKVTSVEITPPRSIDLRPMLENVSSVMRRALMRLIFLMVLERARASPRW